MPTLRRYLRVSEVLECRLWLNNPGPSDANWLANPATTDRIFAAIRHLVQPKLEEARATRGKKSRVNKDNVTGDDFDVSVFLTKTGTYHSILLKSRVLNEPAPPPLKSNTSKLTEAAASPPGDSNYETPVIIREEESDNEAGVPDDIPEVGPARAEAPGAAEDPLFIPHASSDSDEPYEPPTRSRRKDKGKGKGKSKAEPVVIEDLPDDDDDDENTDDKKKMVFDINYEGFSIYDRVLCLVVTRHKKQPAVDSSDLEGKGKMPPPSVLEPTPLEHWLSMSQMQGSELDDDD